jgi:hypothetical protein
MFNIGLYPFYHYLYTLISTANVYNKHNTIFSTCFEYSKPSVVVADDT